MLYVGVYVSFLREDSILGQ